MAANTSRRRRRTTLAIGAAAAVTAGATLLALPATAATAQEGVIHGAGVKGAVNGSYIVMLKGDQGVRAASAGKELAKEYGGKLNRTYTSALNGFSASGLTEREAKRLAGDEKVAKVVQNHRFHATATQDNPPSWGLDRIDQDTTEGDDKYTYPDSAGEGVTAYIIDTGVRISHKDFGGRAEYGYDAVDDDNEADDGQGHGTHVAGTVAGTDHGVAKKAKVVAVRVLDDQGSGTTEQVVAGIDWVTKNAKGPSVANMSLGGPQDDALDAAVKKSIDAGVTYAVAAGNEGADADTSSPARLPEAITVAASDKTDKQASFSNYGKLVDLYAPGVDIVSSSNAGDDATETLSGTSMAAPHVTGAAAVYLGAHNDATPDQVTTALTDGATQDAISNPSQGTPNKLLKVTD